MNEQIERALLEMTLSIGFDGILGWTYKLHDEDPRSFACTRDFAMELEKLMIIRENDYEADQLYLLKVEADGDRGSVD